MPIGSHIYAVTKIWASAHIHEDVIYVFDNAVKNSCIWHFVSSWQVCHQWINGSAARVPRAAKEHLDLQLANQSRIKEKSPSSRVASSTATASQCGEYQQYACWSASSQVSPLLSNSEQSGIMSKSNPSVSLALLTDVPEHKKCSAWSCRLVGMRTAPQCCGIWLRWPCEKISECVKCKNGPVSDRMHNSCMRN